MSYGPIYVSFILWLQRFYIEFAKVFAKTFAITFPPWPSQSLASEIHSALRGVLFLTAFRAAAKHRHHPDVTEVLII